MIMAVNTGAVSVLRYGAGVINWTKAELESIGRKTLSSSSLPFSFVSFFFFFSLCVCKSERKRNIATVL